MRRGMMVCVLGALLPWTANAQNATALQGRYQARLDDAVARGLVYLASQQLDEAAAQQLGQPQLAGSFQTAAVPGNTGITSLAVMAFLAKGHLPGRGRYGRVINRGIDYVLSQQLDNGLLVCQLNAGRTTGLMYEHSIATLLLCEVSGMVDGKRQQQIDQVLPRALLVLLQAQKVPRSDEKTGGWRYTPGTTDSDLSLTGWSIMALRAARLNGAAIPDEHIEMAVSYILNCHRQDGGFAYMPSRPASSTAMTGIGVLCLELCGEHGSDELTAAGHYILARPPRMTDAGGRPQNFRYYAFYYCGQAMFQLGGRQWQEFAPLMYDALLADQKADGSWSYPDGAFRYNTSYPTALAILTLTVSARQLPIYQREE
ncbi:MAG: terpene cyclase/mutase family protein [Planctomycetaceae bacterium]|nr:terpene cyclase/mutase family protein [Planctomycetaceae bacterium]